MSDPRYTDTRPTDPANPRLDPRVDTVVHRNAGAPWAWIGGIAALVLLAFIVMGNWGNDAGTPVTSNNPPAMGTDRAPMNAPATTGSGATTPAPSGATPAPMQPATPPAPARQ